MEHSLSEAARTVSLSRHYISAKPARIKWKPEGNDRFADHFVAGSWDNGRDNSITLWHIPQGHKEGVITSGAPVCKDKYPVNDDVTDLKFVDNSNLVYSTSGGNIGVISVTSKAPGEDYSLKNTHIWSNLHNLKKGIGPVSCNAIDSNETDLITGGSDGRIGLLSTLREEPIGVIGNAGGASIRCVCFLRHNEVVSGDLRGVFRVWDLRSTNKAASVFPYASTQVVSVTAAAVFPAQRHMFIAGSSDGSITLWDLRKSNTPSFVYNAHQSSVTCIHFHHTRSSNMFTSSDNGEIWHWHNFERQFTIPKSPEFIKDVKGPRFTKAAKYDPRPRVTSLKGALDFPINSVDSNRVSLVGASDLECAVLVDNLELDQY